MQSVTRQLQSKMPSPATALASQVVVGPQSYSRHWSSDVSSADHKDLQATAMAMDASGRLAILGGRKYLALVDLEAESPLDVSFRVPFNSRWDVTKVSWCPLPSFGNQLAVATHNRVSLFTVHPASITPSHSPLNLHTRQVSDIDWNRVGSPPILASASLDNFVYLWDVRNPVKPCSTLEALVATSQVRWNRMNDHVLLTSHEGDLKLWDTRYPSLPTSYITAHSARILSLDWSCSSEGQFVTSGQDATVKIFDIGSGSSVPRRSMKTKVPVCKAKFTPFGDGLVTVIIPQLRPREHPLFLWKSDRLDYPVHCFHGHSDVVLDFDWMRNEEKDFQMLSWSRDQTLRLWSVQQSIQTKCSNSSAKDNTSSASSANSAIVQEKPLQQQEQEEAENDPDEAPEDEDSPEELNFREDLALLVESDEDNEDLASLNGGDPSASVAASRLNSREATPSRTISLQQEFLLLNVNSNRHVKVDSLNWSDRSCLISANLPNGNKDNLFSIRVSFPDGYPENQPPSFHFSRGTTLDPARRGEILKAIKTTAKQQVRRNRSCLEPCLRQLDGILEAMQNGIGNGNSEALLEDDLGGISPPPPLPTAGRFADDDNVPHPRTSGASFCSNGLIICFVRPAYNRISASTPRSLSAFGAQSQVVRTMDEYRARTEVGAVGGGSSYLSLPTPKAMADCSSLKRKGRFRVRRVRTGSTDETNNNASNKINVVPTERGELLSNASNPDAARKVVIYDASKLFPFDKTLARMYTMSQADPEASCKLNCIAAMSQGRPESARLWMTCAQIASLKDHVGHDTPWVAHPLGRPMLTSILDHLIKTGDVQMASLILCIFKPKTEHKKVFPPPPTALPHFLNGHHTLSPGHRYRHPTDVPLPTVSNIFNGNKQPWVLQPNTFKAASPYHTIHSSDGRSKKKLFLRGLGEVKAIRSEASVQNCLQQPPRYRASRSNSWGDAYEEALPHVIEEVVTGPSLLDPELFQTYEMVKRRYADVLLRWKLLLERCALFKTCGKPAIVHRGCEPSVTCWNCGEKNNRSVRCRFCKRVAMRCIVCRMAVNGLAAKCSECGHAGHFDHVREWFRVRGRCPAPGCGCRCPEVMGKMSERPSEFNA